MYALNIIVKAGTNTYIFLEKTNMLFSSSAKLKDQLGLSFTEVMPVIYGEYILYLNGRKHCPEFIFNT